MAEHIDTRASEPRDSWLKTKQELLALRDEIRLKVHLGGMDLRAQWQKLEPRLQEIERYASEVGDASKEMLGELVERFRTLKESLEKIRDEKKVRPPS